MQHIFLRLLCLWLRLLAVLSGILVHIRISLVNSADRIHIAVHFSQLLCFGLHDYLCSLYAKQQKILQNQKKNCRTTPAIKYYLFKTIYLFCNSFAHFISINVFNLLIFSWYFILNLS